MGSIGRAAFSSMLALGFISGCLTEEQKIEYSRRASETEAIISFNGLFYDGCKDACDRMAKDLGSVHFTGGPRDEDELEVLKNARKVYLVAHSAGAGPAREYADFLGKRGIDVREIYFLDAFGSGEVSSNVSEFTDLHSSYGVWRRDSHLGSKFHLVRNSNHVDLPDKAKPFIKEDIFHQRRR